MVDAIIGITVVSIGVALFSQFLQKKLGSKQKMKENKQQIKDNQKKIKELMGREDEKSKREVETLQKEMMQLMGDSMQASMKQMVFGLPIFLVVFWGLSMVYGSTAIQLPFPLPVIHRNFSFEITSRISWLWWYIYTSLVIGIILGKVIGAFEKRGKI